MNSLSGRSAVAVVVWHGGQIWDVEKSKSFTQTQPTWGKSIGIQCIRRLMLYRHKTTYGDFSILSVQLCHCVHQYTTIKDKQTIWSTVQCGAFNNINMLSLLF